MIRPHRICRLLSAALTTVALATACAGASAAERVTLANGFQIDCARREMRGDQVRLFLAPAADGTGENYMDVPASAVVGVEQVPDAPRTALPTRSLSAVSVAATHEHTSEAQPTAAELHAMLAEAGGAHHIDVELLASVVHAESGGHAHAVSRTGAQGLMQLMPATAASLGVTNAFAAAENVEGGTRYLDQLLTRYHDNIALALAAYNAGPGAVDRYHGVPPFHETRAYVARVIGEFNRRKLLLLPGHTPAATHVLAAAIVLPGTR